MKLLKKLFIFTVLLSTSAFVFAQNNTDTYAEEEEVSVESEYLNDMVADTISALANADDLESKYFALQYLRDAIASGNTSDSVIQSLDKLAGEGVTNQNRENNRLTNNFPEIRREACLLMAQVPTEHTKNILVSVAKEDLEPTVVAAAVYSLGKIAEEVGTVDEVITDIAFFIKRFSILNPTSSLAWEVLVAFENLADSASPECTYPMIETVVSIANNYYYKTAVRDKAKILLKKFSGSKKESTSEK